MSLICNILNLPLDFRFPYSFIKRVSNGMELAITDVSLLLITEPRKEHASFIFDTFDSMCRARPLLYKLKTKVQFSL